jgi:GTPase
MPHRTAPLRERVILAGVETPKQRGRFAVEMDELESLARAAGGEIVGRLEQRRPSVDPATLIGSGKMHELARQVETSRASVVVTLNPLRPRQRAAIERSIDGIAVLDRSVLILDIFARHARTSEGKLQVELAQLRHRAANLIGSRDELSRLGGGIGTRGPGETKLEVDRRRIRLRIAHLERQLSQIRTRRAEQRRSRAGTPVVGLVGYTNSGKSSLLNALSGAHVFVADQPFATLDPTLRKIRLPGGGDAIVADTVGFISDLPRELVAAFRATLEEVTSASLLLHVIDASNQHWQRQRESVDVVLRELGAHRTPVIYVWNKSDLLAPAGSRRNLGDAGVVVSAKTKDGLLELLDAIAERLRFRPDQADHDN